MPDSVTFFSFRWTASVFLCAFLSAFLLAAVWGKREEGKLVLSFLSGCVFFLPVIAAGIFSRLYAWKKVPDLSGKRVFPLWNASPGKKTFFLAGGAILGGVLLQAPVLLLGVLQHGLFRKLGVPLPPQEKVTQIMHVLESADPVPGLFLLLIPPLLFAPLAEELFFRLILFETFRKVWEESKAIWASVLLFALIHGSVSAFLPLILVGFVCQKVFLKSRSLLASVLLHFSFNLTSFLLLLWKCRS
ncbi:MAG: CPBP family intramembrane metalloprotease [Lentisphaeria bacterium]|nr:CPBP family intramembrane metalloprotease [Lentisphaeria bacterium]